jgi:hypothetical protein
MGLLDWFKRRRAQEDAELLERAEARAVEAPNKRAEVSGDVEGLAADNEAAERVGEGSTIETERRLSE